MLGVTNDDPKEPEEIEEKQNVSSIIELRLNTFLMSQSHQLTGCRGRIDSFRTTRIEAQ
jgi:hypothetical protein